MIAIALALSVAWVGAIQSPQGVALPKEARRLLDDRFRGWSLADVGRAGNEPCLDALKGRSPSFVVADFDNDARMDYGLQIATGDAGYLLVLLTREGRYEIFELVKTTKETGAILDLASRGRKYLDHDTGHRQFFLSETLTATHCGKAASAYLWTGTGFREVVIAD